MKSNSSSERLAESIGDLFENLKYAAEGIGELLNALKPRGNTETISFDKK